MNKNNIKEVRKKIEEEFDDATNLTKIQRRTSLYNVIINNA